MQKLWVIQKQGRMKVKELLLLQEHVSFTRHVVKQYLMLDCFRPWCWNFSINYVLGLMEVRWRSWLGGVLQTYCLPAHFERGYCEIASVSQAL